MLLYYPLQIAYTGNKKYSLLLTSLPIIYSKNIVC